MRNKRSYTLLTTTLLTLGLCNLGNVLVQAEECTTIEKECKTEEEIWSNVGAVTKVESGLRSANETYIIDYKQEQISSNGKKRMVRVDYIFERYDTNGRLRQVQDNDYDADGVYVSNTTRDYRYNPVTKKDILARTRIYENSILISDVKVPTTWKDEGTKKFITGKSKQKNGTYTEDYKNLKVSNFGERKWTRVGHKVYTYNSKAEVLSIDETMYNSKGKYTGKVVNYYKYNPITKKNVVTRTRKFDSKKLISDKTTATTWKNDGAKKKYTKGMKKTANGTYTEDYKQKQVSNFGQRRTIRVDYKVWKYNKYKHVVQEQNYDYDKNGVYTKKTVYDCYYDSMTKKQVRTRIRTYTKDKKTSDLKKNQLKRPTRKGTITNEFKGLDLTYSTGHKGIDIAAPTGTAIYPVIGGKIIEISYDRIGGNKVVVQHRINGIDYVTYYGHMSKLTRNYKVGSIVDVNDKIGTVGSSGLATGPHVHFELMVGTNKKNRAKAVNPRTYIDFPKLWKSY